jgi:hypothetical protein
MKILVIILTITFIAFPIWVWVALWNKKNYSMIMS